MIQYYIDLEKQVKNIKEKALSQGQIQKLYSTAYYISLTIRAPGKTWHLYVGRGSGYEGLWLHDSPPPSELRRKDNFLEYWRRHLSSCSFLDVDLDKNDRIVKLTYRKFGNVQSLLLFWRGRKLYFLHHYQDGPEEPFKLLLSWHGKAFVPTEGPLDFFEYFDEVGRMHDRKHDMVSPSIPTMDLLLLEETNNAKNKGMNSSGPTFLQRKKENIKDDLRKAQQWHKLQSILDNGEPLEGLYELKVDDQKLKFEADLNAYERRNVIFQKIKKLKRGENILNERLGNVEEQMVGKATPVIKTSSLTIVKPVWGIDKGSVLDTVKTQTQEYKVFQVEDYQIGVGLNSQGNDQLRNKWAKRDDYWLHLDGLKSAHVVIKVQSGGGLSSEILNLGASILAYFSHFNGEWIPILYTQVKNLKGVSGSAGMVVYKKEKHLRCPKVGLEQFIKE